MAIPIHLQQFKAAGIYRVVFDKSTIVNYDTELLRLVVGYSEQGPFNVPVYVKDPQTFTALFGGINKKLEKRGVFFHRLALQMLQVSPCLVLNLKKFSNESVGAATISTQFNPSFNPINEVTLNVEDIYDTTRFWTLDAEKLNNLRSKEGIQLDQYINIATTNTKKTSASIFIRKASGLKVSQYNITVNDWYSDNPAAMPDYLAPYKNSLISDFFAEIYVFSGQFTPKQVLASDTLKNFFIVEDTGETDDNGNKILELKLRNKVYNGFGDAVDTLDMLFQDTTSNPLGHYIGCLIPEFKTKNNVYASLDIAFNTDIDVHNMMMSFNTDMLYEYEDASVIDLSGRRSIPTQEALDDNKLFNNGLSLAEIFNGTAKTTVLGNVKAPVVADEISISTNVAHVEDDKLIAIVPFNANGKNAVSGTLYVTGVEGDYITLKQVGEEGQVVKVQYTNLAEGVTIYDIAADKYGVVFDVKPIAATEGVKYTQEEVNEFNAALEGAKHAGDVETEAHDDQPEVTYTEETANVYNAALPGAVSTDDYKEEPVEAHNEYSIKSGFGTGWIEGEAFKDDMHIAGPEKLITSITNLEIDANDSSKLTYTDIDTNLKVNFIETQFMTSVKSLVPEIPDGNSVYGSSISFIDHNESNWEWKAVGLIDENIKEEMLVSENYWDSSLTAILKPGDCLLAKDNIVDYNDNGYTIDPETGKEDDADNYLDSVYVQEVGTRYYQEDDKDVKDKKKNVGDFRFHYVKVSGEPLVYPNDEDNTQPTGAVNQFIVRFDNALNQEIGTMKPLYLEGYTYAMSKPDGVGMYAKVEWQKKILSVLNEYKGLRTGLLNKSEIDYRYVIDTFQSFPDASIKKELSYLCKEKQSAFCIANFPSVQTFTKCPYAAFTDSKGVFNVEYVVKGCNKKKASSVSFSMPDDTEGASFIAFYTPLKFSDGYLDTIVPSAGLVSNLFIQKYLTRQPYYIVAGPNYGRVNASGMVGPDYKYSMDELQIIEPFGVNCMVYRPNFGTFINANQTAKQVPLSALSKVHVRELVIYLMDEVEKVLQAYQWEFNNGRTREAILTRVNNICSRIMANGGLQAYLNIMDESNNTPEIIDNEMAVLSTHIEPGMGCGKMVHELTLYRTGQMQSSIAEA